MSLARQESDWTPDTLYLWARDKFTDMEKLHAALVEAQEKRLDKLETDMNQRFDGVDENFNRLTSTITTLGTGISALRDTVSERTGMMNVIRTLAPILIALGSLIALIVLH
jgi:hypothetical protein